MAQDARYPTREYTKWHNQASKRTLLSLLVLFQDLSRYRLTYSSPRSHVAVDYAEAERHRRSQVQR